MPRILISYRREDSAAYAGRLFDRLSQHFGRDNVFIDIDAIKPGQDFLAAISASVIASHAVVAVIGKRWLTETDASGQRRLDRSDDLLRVEIATALNRGVTVIPVLVGNATMPDPADLPPDLAKLGRLQALPIDDTRFDQDVRRLIDALPTEPTAEQFESGQSRSRARMAAVPSTRWWVGGGAVVVALVLAYSLGLFGPRSTPETSPVADAPAAGSSASIAGRREPIGSAAREFVDGLQVTAGPPPATRTLDALGTIDNPQRMDLGVTYRVPLDKGEAAFLAPATALSELLLVLDMRPFTAISTNLQGVLSILDADGATIEPSAIRFNEVDYGYRRTRTISFGRKPATVRLKIANGERSNVYWLTAFNVARVPFVPLFGHTIPRTMKAGEAQTGRIERGEDVFYATTLTKGTYKIIVDVTNAPAARTNIQAYLAVLDAFGGDQETLLRFNEIDYSYRKIGAVTVKRDGIAMFRFQNDSVPATYSIRLVRQDETPQ